MYGVSPKCKFPGRRGVLDYRFSGLSGRGGGWVLVLSNIVYVR